MILSVVFSDHWMLGHSGCRRIVIPIHTYMHSDREPRQPHENATRSFDRWLCLSEAMLTVHLCSLYRGINVNYVFAPSSGPLHYAGVGPSYKRGFN